MVQVLCLAFANFSGSTAVRVRVWVREGPLEASELLQKWSDPKILEIKTYLFENFSQKKGSRKF